MVDSGYEPGDITAAKELRRGKPYLVRAAPATYQLAIEGKEAPWSRLLVRAYDALTAAEKLQLLLLTSNVRTEFMKAAAIQHRILCTALIGAAMAAFHEERKWCERCCLSDNTDADSLATLPWTRSEPSCSQRSE